MTSTLLITTPIVATADLSLLAPYDVEVLSVPFEIGIEERARRERERSRTDEPDSLTEQQRDAFTRADMLISLDIPLHLPTTAPNVRWIQSIGSGVGSYAPSIVDTDVVVTNTSGMMSGPIADWVVGRLLEVHKRFADHRRQQKDHIWQMAMGTDIADSTIVIVGLGAIGRAVAQRLRPFGPRLIGIRASYRPGMVDDDVDELMGPDELDRALQQADAVVLAAPAHERNEDMFDDHAFATMPPGGIFVNVARGQLVDEGALIGALTSGHLAHAAIDVARNEPLPPDDPLWTAPNLMISPHSSVVLDRFGEKVFEMFLENLPSFLSGQPMRRVVDFSAGY